MEDGPQNVIRNWAATIAAGLTQYDKYDCRVVDVYPQTAHQFSCLDWDDGFKAEAIAYAVGINLLDHSTGSADVCSGSTICFQYTRSGIDPIAVLYSADQVPRQITLAGITNGQMAVYDIMGNNITPAMGTTVNYGRIPRYVVGVGISASTLSTAFSTGTIATRTDAVAPNVLIADAPLSTPSFTLPTRFRWIGIDDESYPNHGEFNSTEQLVGPTPNPDAILYCYQVVGEDGGCSAWTEAIYLDRILTSSATSFKVKAKDEAGNESSFATVCLQSCSVPTLTLLTPSFGTQGTSVGVTLTGTVFDGGNAVVGVTGFGVSANGCVVVSAVTITCTFAIDAAATTGSHTVSVTTDLGTSGGLIFTVNSSVAPTPGGTTGPGGVNGKGRGKPPTKPPTKP